MSDSGALVGIKTLLQALQAVVCEESDSRFCLMLIVGNEDPDPFFILRQVSAYPVILSLENHCSQEQQEILAQYLTSILGDKLLSALLDQPTDGNLPSPNVRLAEDAACRRVALLSFCTRKKKTTKTLLCVFAKPNKEKMRPLSRHKGPH